jgi:serine/threonine protein kinase
MEKYPTVCSGVPRSFLDSVINIRELGKGAYGTVKLVSDNSRSYAVKYIDTVSENSSSAALLEIDALVRLKGANGIIQLEGICYQGNTVALVLEVMDSNLRDYILSTPVNTRIQQLPYILNKISYILSLLESLNIAHFDIKPHNILVKMNSKGLPDFKLSDYGLARATLMNTIPSSEIFTVWYRPPELLSNRDRRTFRIYSTDIWAAGATLLEFVVGKPVFQGRNNYEVLEKILRFSSYQVLHKFFNDNWSGNITGQIDVLGILRTEPELQGKYIHPDLISVLSMMLTLNPNHRPTGPQILKSFKQAVSPNYLLTFFPLEGPRRINTHTIDILIKTAKSLKYCNGSVLIAIEMFTRYLTIETQVRNLMACCLASILIAGNYNEDKSILVSNVLYYYYGHVRSLDQLSLKKEDVLIAERYILSGIEFKIYNINLTPVIQRSIVKNIDLTKVNPNVFAEPLNLWMI